MRRDLEMARSCGAYFANSRVVASRLESAYGIDAEVLHPPVTVNGYGAMSPIPGVAPGFWLVVARRRAYKNTAAVVAAAVRQHRQLVVVGGEPLSHPNVLRLTGLSDGTLRWLYANARATIAAAHEDFGLTPIESNLFGTPSLALRAGGYLETVKEGGTGLFFDDASPEAILAGMASMEAATFDRSALIAHAKSFSQEAFISRILEVCEEQVDRVNGARLRTATGRGT
jgi:glycosyltransferase involved in cell wall biosynthesis